jgi:peptidoglycan/xylan/chitin deacetylase (PgdA/CDA1 family)
VADEIPHVEVARAEWRLRTVALLYHDVVQTGHHDESGFSGPGPSRYKLEANEFDRHLQALKKATGSPPSLVTETPARGREPVWFLTFDDGGASAPRIAEALARYAWRAHFFITVNRIDRPAFVTTEDIRYLHDLGHVIGSHSYSHPERMSHCSWDELLWEWETSADGLSKIVGEQVVTASVPAGFYSKQVARAAAAAGLKVLFNSEPVTRVRRVDGCLVIGRFALQRGTSPETAAALATSRPLPRLRQFAHWNAKKAAKTVGGEAYVGLRRAFLNRR